MVTRTARIGGDCRRLIRLLLTHAQTSEDTLTHQGLVPVIQLVVVERFILAFLVPLAQLCQPFLIGLLGCSPNARLVLVGTHNHLVSDVGVRALTTKAPVTLSQLAARAAQGIGAATLGTISAIRAVAIAGGIPPAVGVAIQRTFSLASKSASVGSKCLTSDRVTCDGTDQLDFILGQLHGGKNLPKATTLEGGGEIMEEGMISIILLEYTEEAASHAINKSIANTLGEPLVACKRAHGAHHALIICVHRNANMVAIPINMALLDMVKGGLRLVRVASANLCKDRGTDLMLSKLEDFPIDVQIDIIGVGICGLQIEVRCAKEHRAILLHH